MRHGASSFKMGHTSASHRKQFVCIMCLLCVTACLVCTFPRVKLQSITPQAMAYLKNLPHICWHSSAPPSSIGPIHPPFSFLQYPCHPPLSLFLIYLLSITLSHSPSLIGPSLVTGMLTGTVYNKKEEVLTLSVANISNQQSSFHRPMTKSKLLLYSKSHISRPCSI